MTWEYRLYEPHCGLPVARVVPLFPVILALSSLCLNLNPAMLHLLIQPAETTQVKKKYIYIITLKQASTRTRSDGRKCLGTMLLQRRMADKDYSFWLHPMLQQNLTFSISRTNMVFFLSSFYLPFVNICRYFLFGCCEYFTVCYYLK